MLRTAIILAGGLGKRLLAKVSDVPKPMAPINQQPFLNYQLKYLKHFGIQTVILSVGHLAFKIKEYYGNSFDGISLQYAVEEKPMGTGGGIRMALLQCRDNPVLVLNGDSFFDVDLGKFYELHLLGRAQASLALRKVENAARYGSIELGASNRITSFKEKSDESCKGLINGGIYILDIPHFLKYTLPDVSFSIEKDFFENKVGELTLNGYEFEGYFIDIGVPDDYEKAQHDFKEFKY